MTPEPLRRAVAADEHSLARLNRFVHDLHLARRREHFKPTRPDELAAWFSSLIPKPGTMIWIAELDRVPVGYVLAFVREAPENPFCPVRRWCEIDQVAVDPACRRQGLGRALIERVCAEARDRGVRDVELSAWAFNDVAQAAFRGLGFSPRTIRFERQA